MTLHEMIDRTPLPDSPNNLGDWETLGWAVADADGSSLNEDGERPYQLQRYDEDSPFDDDEHAHRHVLACAQRGDQMALETLRFLKAYSRREFDQIMALIEPAPPL